MLHIYTGDGKGKTTAALGLLVRAFGAGLRVAAVYFDKGGGSPYHERRVLDELGIPYVVTGCERRQADGSFRFANADDDRREATRGLQRARDLMTPDLDLLVLDEALTCLGTGLLPRPALLALLAAAPARLELVLTGRSADDEPLLARADLVSRVTKVRHYFDRGQASRPGIEY